MISVARPSHIRVRCKPFHDLHNGLYIRYTTVTPPLHDRYMTVTQTRHNRFTTSVTHRLRRVCCVGDTVSQPRNVAIRPQPPCICVCLLPSFVYFFLPSLFFPLSCFLCTPSPPSLSSVCVATSSSSFPATYACIRNAYPVYCVDRSCGLPAITYFRVRHMLFCTQDLVESRKEETLRIEQRSVDAVKLLQRRSNIQKK